LGLARPSCARVAARYQRRARASSRANQGSVVHVALIYITLFRVCDGDIRVTGIALICVYDMLLPPRVRMTRGRVGGKVWQYWHTRGHHHMILLLEFFRSPTLFLTISVKLVRSPDPCPSHRGPAPMVPYSSPPSAHPQSPQVVVIRCTCCAPPPHRLHPRLSHQR
jgi:hypothetical protein